MNIWNMMTMAMAITRRGNNYVCSIAFFVSFHPSANIPPGLTSSPWHWGHACWWPWWWWRWCWWWWWWWWWQPLANLPDALLCGEKLSLKLCIHMEKNDQYEVCDYDDDDDNEDDDDDEDDSHRPTGLTNKPCDWNDAGGKENLETKTKRTFWILYQSGRPLVAWSPGLVSHNWKSWQFCNSFKSNRW